jgi:transposase
MNKQGEILRLKGLGVKEGAIARALQMSRKTVRKYLQEDPDPKPPEASFSFDWDEIIREHQVSDVPLLRVYPKTVLNVIHGAEI